MLSSPWESTLRSVIMQGNVLKPGEVSFHVGRTWRCIRSFHVQLWELILGPLLVRFECPYTELGLYICVQQMTVVKVKLKFKPSYDINNCTYLTEIWILDWIKTKTKCTLYNVNSETKFILRSLIFFAEPFKPDFISPGSLALPISLAPSLSVNVYNCVLNKKNITLLLLFEWFELAENLVNVLVWTCLPWVQGWKINYLKLFFRLFFCNIFVLFCIHFSSFFYKSFF